MYFRENVTLMEKYHDSYDVYSILINKNDAIMWIYLKFIVIIFHHCWKLKKSLLDLWLKCYLAFCSLWIILFLELSHEKKAYKRIKVEYTKHMMKWEGAKIKMNILKLKKEYYIKWKPSRLKKWYCWKRRNDNELFLLSKRALI